MVSRTADWPTKTIFLNAYLQGIGLFCHWKFISKVSENLEKSHQVRIKNKAEQWMFMNLSWHDTKNRWDSLKGITRWAQEQCGIHFPFQDSTMWRASTNTADSSGPKFIKLAIQICSQIQLPWCVTCWKFLVHYEAQKNNYCHLFPNI